MNIFVGGICCFGMCVLLVDDEIVQEIVIGCVVCMLSVEFV